MFIQLLKTQHHRDIQPPGWLDSGPAKAKYVSARVTIFTTCDSLNDKTKHTIDTKREETHMIHAQTQSQNWPTLQWKLPNLIHLYGPPFNSSSAALTYRIVVFVSL